MSARSCASLLVSSSVQLWGVEDSAKSVPLTRTHSDLSGNSLLMAWIVSTRKRVRFSNDPPYSSVLLLDSGDRKLWAR